MSEKEKLEKERTDTWKLFKIIFQIILLVSLIMIGFSIVHTINVIGTSDVDYDFTRDIFIDSNNPTINSTYNLKNQTTYTEIYNATYTFTNQHIGDFIDVNDSDASCSISVINSRESHLNVCQLYDGSAGGNADGYDNFGSAQTYGTLEFFMMNSDATYTGTLYLRSATDRILGITIDDDKFKATHLGGSIDISGAPTPLDDTWYHIRIDFECTGGGYMGLAQYDFYIYINGVQYGKYDFANNEVSATKIRLTTATGDSGYYMYLDAMGYSWDSYYNIKENMLPTMDIDTTILEPNRDEFVINGTRGMFPSPTGTTGVDEFNEWSEYGAYYTHIYDITVPNKPDFERVVRCQMADVSVSGGIEREFDLNGKFINITFAHNFADYIINTPLDSDFRAEIFCFSNDSTKILSLKINDTLVYLDSSENEFVLIEYITMDEWYYGNLILNYELDACLLWIYNTSDSFWFSFPLRVSGKSGLDEIQYHLKTGLAVSCFLRTYLDYIGIYESGDSRAGECGFRAINQDIVDTSNPKKHYLLQINANGYFALIGASTNDIDLLPLCPAFVFRDFSEYDNTSLTLNIYYDDYAVSENSSLFIYFHADYTCINFSLSQISLEGVSLIQGSNEYLLEFTYNNVNIQECYFFADNNNNLRYIHQSNGSLDESIQAKFIIEMIGTGNRSIAFAGSHNSSIDSTFVVDYSDNSFGYIYLRNYYSSYNLILPQVKYITAFALNITDIDASENFETRGYISSLTLVYYTDITLTITTLNLINIMIPLIILIIPSVFISGYVKDRRAFLPAFLLMSILCVATDLIPTWLFFIIALGCGVFLLMMYRGRVD